MGPGKLTTFLKGNHEFKLEIGDSTPQKIFHRVWEPGGMYRQHITKQLEAGI